MKKPYGSALRRFSIRLYLLLERRRLFTASGAAGLDLLEEIVALVVYKDECREILYVDFPDGLHSEFRIFYALDALDVVLRKDCSRPADASEIEAAVLLAGIGYLLRAVAFSKHHHASAMALEQIHIRVHPACSRRSH